MRCKSCDNVMTSSEIIWNKQTHRHEELCKACGDTLNYDSEGDVVIYYSDDLEYYKAELKFDVD